MYLLEEDAGEEKVALDEGSADRSYGLQEGRNLCRKVMERARISSAGGYDSGVVRDAVAGILDGLNVVVINVAEKEKSATLSKISLLLDDAFTEVSKVK